MIPITNFVLGVESEFAMAQLKKGSYLALHPEDYLKGLLNFLSPHACYAENQHMINDDRTHRLTAHTLFVKIIPGLDPGFMLVCEDAENPYQHIARLGLSQQPGLHHLTTYDVSEAHNNSLSILDTIHSAESELFRQLGRANDDGPIPYSLPTLIGIIKSDTIITEPHIRNIGVLFIRAAKFNHSCLHSASPSKINHMNFYSAEQLKEFLEKSKDSSVALQTANGDDQCRLVFDSWSRILIENIDAIVKRVKAISHPAN